MTRCFLLVRACIQINIYIIIVYINLCVSVHTGCGSAVLEMGPINEQQALLRPACQRVMTLITQVRQQPTDCK